jgi:hypothetical protein
VDWNWIVSDGASSYFEFANSLRVICQLRGLMVELKELTVQRAQLYLMSSIQDGHAQRDIVELRNKIVEASKVFLKE